MRPEVSSKSIRWALALAVAVAGGWASASPALAQESERDGDWSVGAGLGNFFSGQTLTWSLVDTGQSVVAVPTTNGPGMPLSFSLERRLAPSFWLTLHTDVTFGRNTSKPHDNIGQTSDTTWDSVSYESSLSSSIWSASVGARYVVNPGATVEVGPFLVMGLQGTSFKSSYTTTATPSAGSADPTISQRVEERTASSFGPVAGLGFTVEAFLGRNLSLRFSTLLLGLESTTSSSDSTTKTTTTPPSGPAPSSVPVSPTKDTGSQLNVGLKLAPVLELRIAL